MNRLGGETSPYLRQHAENPVDWYPWGPDALSAATLLDRPIFLSIGYSACHWCHVMAHESFEDDLTASYLNEHFVSIKVDREERPDLDSIYMDAVQAMTGQGGWPMTVFCTPDGKPFFGGTYFPPVRAHGRPSFRELLEAINRAWSGRREDVLGQADDLAQAVARGIAAPLGEGMPDEISPDEVAAANDVALDRLAQMEDRVYGGLGRAPKFPQPPLLELLLRSSEADALKIARRALDAMARGGIYDHLGGGFARYSVDRIWRVPHFEKMLYDQAGLTRAYLHAWLVTGEPAYRQVVDETVGYVLRDLTIDAGGVHAAEDADSEGEEGLYYTWTPKELVEALGPAGSEAAAEWYGATEEGDLDGRSVLHRPPDAPLGRPAEIEELRRTLFEVRRGRIPPGRDDKVLTEWNAMWCSTLAEAAGATGDSSWEAAAVRTGEFLLAELRRPDGRWLRSWQDGRAAHLAYAADYAWLVDCFTRLAELTGRAEWSERACSVAADMIDLFFESGVGLYTTAKDSEQLFVRPRELQDGVIPAASSVAVVALCRIAAMTGEDSLAASAAQILAPAWKLFEKSPSAVPVLLHGASLVVDGPLEVVVTGHRPDLVAEVRSRFLPDGVLTQGEVAARQPLPARPADRAFVCRTRTCSAPVSEPEALAELLGAGSR